MTDTAVNQTQVTPLEDLLTTPKAAAKPTRTLLQNTPPEFLSIEQLLAGLGVKDPSAVNLATLLQLPTASLSGVPAPARQRVEIALELAKRLMAKSTAPSRLDSTELVAAFLSPIYSMKPHEVFGIVALDSKHRVLAHKIVATGGRHSVAITPADVYQAALPFRPRSIVAFHNHPSGDPFPSEEDKALTYRLARAGEVLGIALVDHVVLGSDGSFASFKQLGLL